MAMVDISLNLNSMESSAAHSSLLNQTAVVSSSFLPADALEPLHFVPPTARIHRHRSTSTSVSNNRPQGRVVAFSETVQVIPAASPLDALESDHERDALWYDTNDLDSFRTEARELCRKLRSTTTTLHASSSSQEAGGELKVCSLARDHATRGLEQRTCLERQRRKYLATKCIVRAQHKLSRDRLAALATRCTQWAAALATEEAARDFVRAYLSSEDDDNAAIAQPNNENKRRAEEDDDDVENHPAERRVRPRLAL